MEKVNDEIETKTKDRIIVTAGPTIGISIWRHLGYMQTVVTKEEVQEETTLIERLKNFLNK